MSMSYVASKPKRPPPPKFKTSSSVTSSTVKDQTSLLEQGNPLFAVLDSNLSGLTKESEEKGSRGDLFSSDSVDKELSVINSSQIDPLFPPSDDADDDDDEHDEDSDDLFQSIPSQRSTSSHLEQHFEELEHSADSSDIADKEDYQFVDDHYGTSMSKLPVSPQIQVVSAGITDHVMPYESNEDAVDSSHVVNFNPHPVPVHPVVSHSVKQLVTETEEDSSFDKFHIDPATYSNGLSDFSVKDVNVPVGEVLAAIDSESLKVQQKTTALTEPFISCRNIIFSTVVLYFYYSFMFFSYLSGFFAGVHVFFLLLATMIGFLSYYEDIKKRLAERKWEKVTAARKDAIESQLDLKLDSLPPLKSTRFSLAYDYDPTLRNSSKPHSVRMQLEGFFLRIEVEKIYSAECDVAKHFWQFGEDKIIQELNSVVRIVDLRNCSIFLAPDDVAQDRKRRWSKKYPICLLVRTKSNESESLLYFFVSVARDKEEWYRRMWSATEGVSVQQSAQAQFDFFSYIFKYVPKRSSMPPTALRTKPLSAPAKKYRTTSPNIQLSHLSTEDTMGTSVDSVNPQSSSPSDEIEKPVGSASGRSPVPFSTSVPLQSQKPIQSEISVSKQPPLAGLDSLELSLSWVNVLAARLCWDFWHEEKWRKWVMQKIDKKLKRIQRPSFLEELQITDVHLGNDMPQIKKVNQKPRVDYRGVWAYLDVSYRGTFTMTIETKVTSAFFRDKQKVDTRMRLQNIGYSDGVHAINEDEMSDSDSEEPFNLIKADQPKVGSPGTKKSGKLRSYMNSAWRVATNTKFGKRVTEKVLSYPLILSVEVRRLDGPLVVNIPPPPSDSIWYGFERKPYLSLSAKPKVFNREVTLSYVTDWIEKKLIELVEKKVVHPNMLDFTATPLNSGFPGDKSVSL